MPSPDGRCIAVMQPYFFPYAGYFRLFTAADVVVMFDCVQFPRRGWVHRNRFPDAHGNLDWLTLPLEKAERAARIDQLRFPPDVRGRLVAAMHRFPLLHSALGRGDSWIARVLDFRSNDAAAYLCDTLADVASALGFSKPVIRSSTLAVDPALRGQDRVLAIVSALGGTQYVNPPGGRELYEREAFAKRDIDLHFLPSYGGTAQSILARLVSEPLADISREIERETALVR